MSLPELFSEAANDKISSSWLVKWLSGYRIPYPQRFSSSADIAPFLSMSNESAKSLVNLFVAVSMFESKAAKPLHCNMHVY